MGVVLLLWVVFAAVSYGYCQLSTLTINVVHVINNSNHTFTCSISSESSFVRLHYLKSPAGTVTLRFQNGACTVSPTNSFLSERSRYSYTCDSTVYQVTLYNIEADDRNNILACRDGLRPSGSGPTWIIKGQCDNCTTTTMSFTVKDITEGKNITLACTVSSDESLVNWNKNFALSAAMGVQEKECTTSPSSTFLDNTAEYISTCNKTVYQVTKLNVQGSEHNDIYMCTPQSQPEGQGSNWVIKVKAPVKSVTMTAAVYEVKVIENTAVEFTCTTSTARPAASVYWYIHPNGNSNNITQITENITTMTDYNEFSVTTSTLPFVPARQHNNMTIFCSANNSINTSPVMSNKKLLNILYKADDPYVMQGNEYRLMENNPGTLSCSVKGGNPTPTLFWSCNNVSPTNQSTSSSNGNITTKFTWTALRNHEGSCTCTSSQQTWFQKESINVTLVVLYAASVTSFAVEGISNQTVTVNETNTVTFICNADSNPTAVTTLSDESKMIKNVSSNDLTYMIEKASCLEAGTYACSARNIYNGDGNAQMKLQLFVNCYPRAAGVIETNITSEKNKAISIVFNVIAYPPPKFTWWQRLNDTWKELKTDDNFDILSSSLQSNFTILRVRAEDFTSYKVMVENNVGKMEQLYALSPYDKPDPPTGFRHIESRTTTSSIHLEWKPGFDNGPPQTFFIKYKRSSDTPWNYIDVPDNGEQTMERSLTGLIENTQYEIVIIASNEKGNSSESNVLVTTTEATDKPTNLGPLIGGIAGGVTGSIILVIVIIVLIRRYPLLKGNCADDQDIRRSVSEDSDGEDGLLDNPMYASSSNVASPASTSSDVYAKPIKPKTTNVTGAGDIYAVVNRTKKQVDVYENFELETDPSKKGVAKQVHPEKPPTIEPQLKSVNKECLIYADLVFNDKQLGEKMVITGDDPTPYDLVDFTKKADPLPESDNEDDR